MKRFLGIMLILLVAFATVVPAQAQWGKANQATDEAAQDSVLDKASDWFATLGKSDEEKRLILTERKAKRAKERLEKRARQAAKKAEKEAERMKKEAGKEYDKHKGSHKGSH